MLNLSGLHPQSVPGHLLRLPLRALRVLPRQTTIRIIQGPLRGYRWTIASAIHGCWLGTYEASRQQAIARVLKPGMVFFDIGAHVGFYTLLGAHLVSPYGQVFAFEPSPANFAHLKRHLEINGIDHVTALQAAVSDCCKVSSFDLGRASTHGHLSETGGERVEVYSLDFLWQQGRLPLPDAMKIDVEGAELSVLQGACEVLRRGRPTIFLETHGEHVHRECLSFLRGYGYQCEEAKDEITARQP